SGTASLKPLRAEPSLRLFPQTPGPEASIDDTEERSLALAASERPSRQPEVQHREGHRGGGPPGRGRPAAALQGVPRPQRARRARVDRLVLVAPSFASKTSSQ